jgi:uncharacterized protein YfaT (DUF1175 family)
MPKHEVKFTVVDDTDLPIARKTGGRRQWALDVAKAAKEHPNQWLKLEGAFSGSYSRYLKPLGLRVAMRNLDKKTQKGTMYVVFPAPIDYELI